MKVMFFMFMSMIASAYGTSDDPLAGATQTAEAFVKLVDDNNAEELAKILHPDMMQYARLGEKIMPFKAADFVQMVAEKKLGGTPRSISLASVQLVRGDTADVVLQAVSSEYDFMYQISLIKDGEQWLIVSVMSDIRPVK
ncbi:MAG: nuclear transport factor 2 family protein [Bacteroidota bacterium]